MLKKITFYAPSLNLLHLDLSYPEGHEYEGKQLEKMCIIGEPSINKTVLLKEIIAHVITKLPQQSNNKNNKTLASQLINAGLQLIKGAHYINHQPPEFAVIPPTSSDKLIKTLNHLLQPMNTTASVTNGQLELHHSIKETHIPKTGWSNGIKQIVHKLTQISSFNAPVNVCCIDEPETSLHPTTQEKIIESYTKLAPNCQFFFTTNSPIILSNFAPWEIVDLHRDKDGKVQRKLYYKGKNHVDNYKNYPNYMRWDATLQNCFGVHNDGSNNRHEMLQEYANLNTQLKAKKDKGVVMDRDHPDVQRLLELGNKLGWDC